MNFQDIYSKTYLVTFFVFALLETLLLSGITYGWASIVVVFKTEHFYLNLCHDWYKNRNETFPAISKNFLVLEEVALPGCPRQDEMFNLIFTVALFCLCGIKFPAGVFVDRCGPRMARFVGGTIYLAASLGLGFIIVGYEDFLFPTFIGLAMGGSLLVVAVYQVSNIVFRDARSRVLCILHGAFDSSAVFLLIFKLIYEAGVEFRTIMYVYSGVCFLFILFGTILFIPSLNKLIDWSEEECEITAHIHSHSAAGPDFIVRSIITTGRRGFVASTHYPNEAPPPSKGDRHRCSSTPYNEYNPYDTDDEDDSLVDGMLASSENLLPTAPSKSSLFPRGSVFRSIFSPLYLFELIFLLTFQLKLWYFVGSLPDYLERLTNNDKHKVSEYINLFGYIQFGGIVVTPIIGFIFDRNQLSTNDAAIITPAERRIEALRTSIPPFLITNILCLVFCIFGLFEKLYFQIPSYILYTVVRGFLYANHGAYMGRAFPASQFGTLYGLGIFIGGTFGILQYFFFNLTNKTFHGDPFWSNAIMLILVAIGNIHPFYLWWYCHKQKKRLRARSFQPVDT